MGRVVGAVVADLRTLLESVTGDWSVARTEPLPERDAGPLAGIGPGEQNDCEVWVDQPTEGVRTVLTCAPTDRLAGQDLRVLGEMLEVFAHDLAVVGDSIEAQEVWRSLADTRFLRGAARLSAFATGPLVEWVRTFEAATQQTYEGVPFSGKVVLVKDLASYLDHAHGRFRRFEEPIEIRQALLQEKWLKPFLARGEFSLVVLGETGEAHGFSDACHAWPEGDGSGVADPGARSGEPTLPPDSVLLTALPSGDISFALSCGTTFVNSQGRWRHQNWDPLGQVLAAHCEPAVTRSLLHWVTTASEARTGALVVVLPEGAPVSDIVPDHESVVRTARTLRDTVRGMNIREPFAARVLRVASRIDGAVLVSSDGTILDVASMITEPDGAALEDAGHTRLRRLGGGRSTAAWNASILGLAIKVSEDGPVQAFERGHRVFPAG